MIYYELSNIVSTLYIFDKRLVFGKKKWIFFNILNYFDRYVSFCIFNNVSLGFLSNYFFLVCYFLCNFDLIIFKNIFVLI